MEVEQEERFEVAKMSYSAMLVNMVIKTMKCFDTEVRLV